MKKLSENALLQSLPADMAAALEKKARRFEVKSDEVLFNEGDTCSELYLIESGRVQILKKFQADRVVMLDELGEGDFVGELALLDRQARSATARAVTPVTGWIFDDSILEVMLSRGREAVVPFLRTLSSRMRQVDTCLIRQRESSERLALLGNMVGTIVHDLKNPLAAMRMSAELLEMKAQDDKTRKVTQLLVQQIDRLTSMIHELLEFARDRIELKVTGRSIDEILLHCSEHYAETCAACGIELTMRTGAPRAIQIDPGKMERVLMNLVKNAIQALKGSKDGRIAVSSQQSANRTTIRIEDNGPGIAEAIRGMLFEPFVTHGKKDGTGLGLSIVKKIVQAHGGEVTFTTQTGKGTAFEIVLPG